MDEKTGTVICPFDKGVKETNVTHATNKVTARMMPWRRRLPRRKLEWALACRACFGFLEPGITIKRPVVGAFMVACKASVSDNAPVGTGDTHVIAVSSSVVMMGSCPEISIGAVDSNV